MITKQEMFNRAVRGLASQGWLPSVDFKQMGGCAYMSDDGTRRCAWGWVDPDEPLLNKYAKSVERAREDKIGLAAELSDEDLEFAKQLQNAHDQVAWNGLDEAGTARKMPGMFAVLAQEYGLTWPEDVTKP